MSDGTPPPPSRITDHLSAHKLSVTPLKRKDRTPSPPPAAIHARSDVCVSDDCPEDVSAGDDRPEEYNHESRSASDVGTPNSSQSEELPATQEESYSASQEADLTDEVADAEIAEEAVSSSSRVFRLNRGDVMTFGRAKGCTVQVDDATVSSDHAQLICSSDGALVLSARRKPVWVERGNQWDEVKSDCDARLTRSQRFGLLRSCHRYRVLTVPKGPAGSASFDAVYGRLLRSVVSEPVQQNKKGDNQTLREEFILKIELEEEEAAPAPSADAEWQAIGLLPLTTLRKLKPKNAIVEALWYLRGESSIAFLQKHGCPFWDAAADNENCVGLNYGLIAHWPRKEGISNQLEEMILKPMCARNGESSRNYAMTLLKPDEPTAQASCTAMAQFTIRDGRLDLHLHQRSSDVIIGLPNDVVVWAILMHLVRREVCRRTDGRVNLRAGRLTFAMPGGTAHAYKLNREDLDELLKRDPKPNVTPRLLVRRDAPGLWELAKDNESPSRLDVEGYEKDRVHPSMKLKLASGTAAAASSAAPVAAPSARAD